MNKALLAVLLALSCTPAIGQSDAYPSRPVRLIIPYPPGASVDVTARTFANKLSERLKQQVLADNIGGAAGVIAAETAARAAPNGYTLLFGTSASMVIAPLLNKQLPYNPARDFDPVSQIISNPLMIVVNSALPVKTPAELIALAKSKPGTLNFGSAGTGSPSQISVELFKSMAGIDIVHVPYKGGAPAQIDLLSGRVQIYSGSVIGLLPSVKSGKLRAMGVTTARRSSALPDVPALSEFVPGYEFDTWYGIFVPAKTPAAIISRVNADLVAITSEPEFVKSMAAQGSEARSSTPQALAAMVRSEYERLGKIMATIGPISQ